MTSSHETPEPVPDTQDTPADLLGPPTSAVQDNEDGDLRAVEEWVKELGGDDERP